MADAAYGRLLESSSDSGSCKLALPGPLFPLSPDSPESSLLSSPDLPLSPPSSPESPPSSPPSPPSPPESPPPPSPPSPPPSPPCAQADLRTGFAQSRLTAKGVAAKPRLSTLVVASKIRLRRVNLSRIFLNSRASCTEVIGRGECSASPERPHCIENTLPHEIFPKVQFPGGGRFMLLCPANGKKCASGVLLDMEVGVRDCRREPLAGKSRIRAIVGARAQPSVNSGDLGGRYHPSRDACPAATAAPVRLWADRFGR